MDERFVDRVAAFWADPDLSRFGDCGERIGRMLAACRVLPPNEPVDIEWCVSVYRGRHVARRRQYFKKRHAIWLITGGRCLYCQRLVKFYGSFHTDHVVPLSAGGRDAPDNLVPACELCNLRKHAVPLQDFLKLMEAAP